MSDGWVVRDTERGNERTADSKAEAQETKDDLVALGARPEQIKIEPPTQDDTVDAEVVDHAPPAREQEAQAAGVVEQTEPEQAGVEPTVPDEKPSLDVDPEGWMPDHFVDTIEGVPTLNRKGYAVMCERFGVSVKSEPVTLASDSDFEFAEFTAVATTDDGTEYTGVGSAHINRKDGDDPYLLNELAETRAMKRAAAWATGIGMTAAEEMQNEL